MKNNIFFSNPKYLLDLDDGLFVSTQKDVSVYVGSLRDAPACNYETEDYSTALYSPETAISAKDLMALLLSDVPQRNIVKETSTLAKNEELIKQKEEFKRNIVSLLVHEPVDDGAKHPVEAIIQESLGKYGKWVSEWTKEIYMENLGNSSKISPSLLHCIGRLPYGMVGEWAFTAAVDALSNNNFQLRYSAVIALELWDNDRCLQALKSYVESEPIAWLKSYVIRVIQFY